jgi:hypothetical protein
MNKMCNTKEETKLYLKYDLKSSYFTEAPFIIPKSNNFIVDMGRAPNILKPFS